MAREVILLLTLFQHYYPSTFKVFLAIPIPPPLKRGILLNIFLSVKFKINAGSVKIRSESKTQIFSNTVSFAWPTLIRVFFPNLNILVYLEMPRVANVVYIVILYRYDGPIMKVTMKMSGFTILKEPLII